MVANTELKVSPLRIDLLSQEYNALRQEILKRIEFAYQLIGITLVAVGTILTVALSSKQRSDVLFVYPILVFFLAATWVNSELTLLAIARYIKDVLEPHFSQRGWETHLRGLPPRVHSPNQLFLVMISAPGIFVGTQLVTFVLAVSYFDAGPVHALLLVLSFLAIAGTIALFTHFTRQRRLLRTAELPPRQTAADPVRW